MEEQMNQLAVTHLLQHTLRSWCIHENSQWVYAVFWRILPRNYPPPKWDSQGGAYDRSRGNRRNWILVWEDGFCNFAASSAPEMEAGEQRSVYGNHEYQTQQQQQQFYQGLQPELFFKMSHEIYNYGEGLIGKVAADHGHKWIYKEPNVQEINLLSAWNNSADSHPRTWEAQFQSGIKTIALIAVREGVIQLGSVHKVIEDLSYVVLLRKKFSYIESIPGALLPHPSSSYPFHHPDSWHFQPNITPPPPPPPPPELCHHFNHPPPPIGIITPSMSSLEALLSKLPSVVPVSASTPATSVYCEAQPHYVTTPSSNRMSVEVMENVVGKEEEEVEEDKDVGESSSSMKSYGHHHQNFSYHNSNSNHHHLNVTSSSMPNNGY